jgi:uncharacterized delta-60 repeat protein
MRKGIAVVRKLTSFLALACALVSTKSAHAGTGALDQGFGVAGKVVTGVAGGNATGNAVVVQPDGKIVVAGSVNVFSSNTSYDFGLVRYTATGQLDSTFGTNGRVVTDVGTHFQDFGNAVALQSDGKVVVVGSSGNDFGMSRYDADGSLDATFGTGGKVRTDILGADEAHAVIVQSDGKIVVAGDANGFGIARYLSNGALDPTFAGDGTTTIRFSQSGTDRGAAVAVQADGRYIVAGTICPGGESCGFGLERFGTDGALDTNFGNAGLAFVNISGGDDRAYALAIQSDGKFVVAGHAGSSGFGLARFTTAGALDTTFGTSGSTVVSFGDGHYDDAFAIALQPNGIFAAGESFGNNFSTATFAIAHFDANGHVDTSFGGGGKLTTSLGENSHGHALALIGADKLLVAGNDSSNNGSFALAQYLLGANTPPGPSTVTQPVDDSTGTTPVTLTLSNVSQGGDTTLSTSASGPPAPEGFQLGAPPTYYEIETTVTFSQAQVCIHYDDVSYRKDSQLKLLHYTGTKWIDVTTSLDKVDKIICGTVNSFSPFAIVEDVCDLPGDVEPDVVGDCDVDLADAAFARRAVRGQATLAARGQLLGDVAPGTMACAAPRDARNWCSDGDGDVTLEDVRVIHQLWAGLKSSCDECPQGGTEPDRRLAGDIAPADGVNGIVDDDDIARAVGFVLGAEEISSESLLRADVSPSSADGQLTVAGGDGQVSVADLVELVRASNGDDTLAWPARQIGVTSAPDAEFESWAVSAPEWPAWAPVASIVVANCEEDDLLGDSTEGGWSVGCVPNGGNETPDADLATMTYRAPEPVALDALTLSTQALDNSFEFQDVGLALAAR